MRDVLTRRQFVSRASLASAGALGFPWIVPASARGAGGWAAPGSRIAIGLIGAGNINNGHREVLLREADARVVAVCDPIASRRDAYVRRINAAYGDSGCASYADFRELLARPDIDAVCIGTPDHWHAAQAIAAMEAGKDVYLEKPLTYTVAEGRQVIAAAARCGRVLQTGLQRRSMRAYRHVCELVRNGRIGRLIRVEVGIVGVNGGEQAGQRFPESPVPGGVDYDLWLGPAPWAPYCPQRVTNHYWYFITDYSRGFIPGNGVHFVDIAQWGIGDDIMPVEVETPLAETPAHGGLIDAVLAWRADVRYANGVCLSFSSLGRPHPDGIRFVGAAGWIHIDGAGRTQASVPAVLQSAIGPGGVRLYDSPAPHRNFLDCIRTRGPTAASPAIGHHATTTCNLVEIAARLGRKLKWDARVERFVGDAAADRLLARAMREPWQL